MSQNTASNQPEDIIELTEVVEYAQKKGAPSAQKIDFDSQLSDLIGKGKEINVNNPPELEALLAGIGEDAQDGGNDFHIDLSDAEIIASPAPSASPAQPEKKSEPLDVGSFIDGLDVPPTASQNKVSDDAEVADLDSLLDTLFSSPAAAQIAAVDKTPEPAPAQTKTPAKAQAPISAPVTEDIPLMDPDLDDLLASVMEDAPAKPKAPQPKAQPLSTDELDALFDAPELPLADATDDPLDALLDSLPSNVTPKLAPDSAVIPTEDELDSLLADLSLSDDAGNALPLVLEPKQPAKQPAKAPSGTTKGKPAMEPTLPLGGDSLKGGAAAFDDELDALFAKSAPLETIPPAAKRASPPPVPPAAAPVPPVPRAAVAAAVPDLLLDFDLPPEMEPLDDLLVDPVVPVVPTDSTVPADVAAQGTLVASAEIERLEGMIGETGVRIEALEHEVREMTPVDGERLEGMILDAATQIEALGHEVRETTPAEMKQLGGILHEVVTRFEKLEHEVRETTPAEMKQLRAVLHEAATRFEKLEHEVREVTPAEIKQLGGVLHEVVTRLETLEHEVRDTAPEEIDLVGSLSEGTPAATLIQEMIKSRLDSELPGRIAEQLPLLLPEPEPSLAEDSLADEIDDLIAMPEEDPIQQTLDGFQTRLTVLEEWQQSELVSNATPDEESVDPLAQVSGDIELLRESGAGLREELDVLHEKMHTRHDEVTAASEDALLRISELQTRLSELEEKIAAVPAEDPVAVKESILATVRPEIRQVAAVFAAAEETATATLNGLQARLIALEARPEAPNAANITQDVLTLVHADMEQAATESANDVLSSELREVKRRNAELEARLVELEARHARSAALEARLAKLESRPDSKPVVSELPDAAAITASILETVHETLEKSAAEAAARVLREEIVALFAALK